MNIYCVDKEHSLRASSLSAKLDCHISKDPDFQSGLNASRTYSLEKVIQEAGLGPQKPRQLRVLRLVRHGKAAGGTQ